MYGKTCLNLNYKMWQLTMKAARRYAIANVCFVGSGTPGT